MCPTALLSASRMGEGKRRKIPLLLRVGFIFTF
jgi:hypothetical protein